MRYLAAILTVSLALLASCSASVKVENGLSRKAEAGTVLELTTDMTPEAMRTFFTQQVVSVHKQWELFAYGSQLDKSPLTVDLSTAGAATVLGCEHDQLVSYGLTSYCHNKRTVFVPVEAIHLFFQQKQPQNVTINQTVVMMAGLAQVYAEGVRAFAKNVFNDDLQMPSADRLPDFGYCVAAALVAATYGTDRVAKEVGGGHAEQVGVKGTIGDCFAKYWR